VRASTVLRPFALLLVLAAGFAGEVAAAEPAARDFKSPVLDRAQIDALLAKPDQIVIIDVRRPDEHQSKGAFPVFISIQVADIEKSLGYIPRDRQVLTVSNHAARAGKAADLLGSHGFKVAGAVGIEDYEKAGGKVYRLAAPPPASPVAKP
jgi:rhodanese-related sulfurtransferase